MHKKKTPLNFNIDYMNFQTIFQKKKKIYPILTIIWESYSNDLFLVYFWPQKKKNLLFSIQIFFSKKAKGFMKVKWLTNCIAVPSFPNNCWESFIKREHQLHFLLFYKKTVQLWLLFIENFVFSFFSLFKYSYLMNHALRRWNKEKLQIM